MQILQHILGIYWATRNLGYSQNKTKELIEQNAGMLCIPDAIKVLDEDLNAYTKILANQDQSFHAEECLRLNLKNVNEINKILCSDVKIEGNKVLYENTRIITSIENYYCDMKNLYYLINRCFITQIKDEFHDLVDYDIIEIIKQSFEYTYKIDVAQKIKKELLEEIDMNLFEDYGHISSNLKADLIRIEMCISEKEIDEKV